MPCELLSTNAGGKLACIDDQAAFMSRVERDHPEWQIIFIAEVDARLASIDTTADKFGGRCSYRRHWPGPGSFAFAVIFRSAIAPFVRDITPLGRCVIIQVSGVKGTPDDPNKQFLYCLHAWKPQRFAGYVRRLS